MRSEGRRRRRRVAQVLRLRSTCFAVGRTQRGSMCLSVCFERVAVCDLVTSWRLVFKPQKTLSKFLLQFVERGERFARRHLVRINLLNRVAQRILRRRRLSEACKER